MHVGLSKCQEYKLILIILIIILIYFIPTVSFTFGIAIHNTERSLIFMRQILHVLSSFFNFMLDSIIMNDEYPNNERRISEYMVQLL